MAIEVSLADAARSIADAGAPVLVPDTCALLDVIRLPFRENTSCGAANTLRAILAIRDGAMAVSPEVALATPSLVLDEWKNNYDAVMLELARHISKIDEAIKVGAAISTAFGESFTLSQLDPMSIDRRLDDLVADMLAHCHILAIDSTVKDRASDRALRGLPPGRKGAIKDALIYEHALELYRQLRTLGFSENLVMLSSNTKDFFGQDKAKPAEPIRTELSDLNACLVSNWQWALGELRK